MSRAFVAAALAGAAFALSSGARAELAEGAEVSREAAPYVVAGEASGTSHLRLDASAIYGIGGQSFLGALLRGSVGLTAWDDENATGTADFGLAFGYHNEPTWLAPWLSHGLVDGAGHCVQLLAVAGHTFHFLDSRALSLGLHLQGGWNRWISSYSLEYPNEGVRGEATLQRDFFVLGGQLTGAIRVADHVGLNLVLGGPFPIDSAYVIGMFHVGAGLTFYVF